MDELLDVKYQQNEQNSERLSRPKYELTKNKQKWQNDEAIKR